MVGMMTVSISFFILNYFEYSFFSSLSFLIVYVLGWVIYDQHYDIDN